MTLYRIDRIDGATIATPDDEIVYAFTLTDSSGSALNIGLDAKLLSSWIALARAMEAKGLDFEYDG
ncbi:hypothetical protein AO501_07710 [Mycobacterium gordonae]|uniref:Uncharacterized protein n=2 Tax=Mycobacteriaceae TaxID=1762 RepID=A0A0Q2R408_MYCGO|nr:hypothetical protein AO501_07710 [Mycobacterium gordonae]